MKKRGKIYLALAILSGVLGVAWMVLSAFNIVKISYVSFFTGAIMVFNGLWRLKRQDEDSKTDGTFLIVCGSLMIVGTLILFFVNWL